MRFVVLGDLHYSVYAEATQRALRDEFFERVFSSVAQQQAEAVFAIGDTTDNGLPEEFEGLHAIARRCGLKFITVNGNHDVLKLTKAEVSRYTGNPSPYYGLRYNARLGQSHPVDDEAARFLVLDTPKERNPKDHGGYVDAEQLEWLAGEIEASAEAPLFAFGHHPVRGATRWSSFPMLCIDNSRAVRQVFKRKTGGSAFYFCGHNHANSIKREGSWSFVQTAAPLRTVDYRLVEWTSEAIELRTIQIEGGEAVRKLAARVADAMGDFSRIPARGFGWDRRLRLDLQGASRPVFAGVALGELD